MIEQRSINTYRNVEVEVPVLRFKIDAYTEENIINDKNAIPFSKLREKFEGKLCSVSFQNRGKNQKKRDIHFIIIEGNESSLRVDADVNSNYSGYNVKKLVDVNIFSIPENNIITKQYRIEFSSLDADESDSDFVSLYNSVNKLVIVPESVDHQKYRKIWDKYVEAYEKLLEKKQQPYIASIEGVNKKGTQKKLDLSLESEDVESVIREQIVEKLNPNALVDFGRLPSIKVKEFSEITNGLLSLLNKILRPYHYAVQENMVKRRLIGRFSLKMLDLDVIESKRNELSDSVFRRCPDALVKKDFIYNVPIERYDKVIRSLKKYDFVPIGVDSFLINFVKNIDKPTLLNELNDFLKEKQEENIKFSSRSKWEGDEIKVSCKNANIIAEIRKEFSVLDFSYSSLEFAVGGDVKKTILPDFTMSDSGSFLYKLPARGHVGETIKKCKAVIARKLKVKESFIKQNTHFYFTVSKEKISDDEKAEIDDFVEFEADLPLDSIDFGKQFISLPIDDNDQNTVKDLLTELNSHVSLSKISFDLQKNINVEYQYKYEQEVKLKEVFERIRLVIGKVDSLKLNDFTEEKRSFSFDIAFDDISSRDSLKEYLSCCEVDLSDDISLSYDSELGETVIPLKYNSKEFEESQKGLYQGFRDAIVYFKEDYGKDEKSQRLKHLEELFADARKNRRSVPGWDSLRKEEEELKAELPILRGLLGKVVRTYNKKGKWFIQLDIEKGIELDKLKDKRLIINGSFPGESAIIRRMRLAMDKVTRANSRTGFSINRNIEQFLFDPSLANRLSEPIFDKNLESYREFNKNKIEKNLNRKQEEAILKVVNNDDLDLFLLQGPPGTGKTTVISEMLWQILKKDPKKRILVSSQTNLAVDNALDRLPNEGIVRPLRIGGNRGKKTLEEKLVYAERFEEGFKYAEVVINAWITSEVGSTTEESTKLNMVNQWFGRINKNISSKLEIDSKFDGVLSKWKKKIDSPDMNMKKVFGSEYLKNVNIVAATCMECGTDEFSTEYSKGFSHVIVDEASKATPPELILPLTFGKSIIIIGDHKQLPPMIDERQLSEVLNDVGATELAEELGSEVFKKSHFEVLFEQSKAHNPTVITELDTQYRMHNDIMEVINQFYSDIENSKGGKGLICGLNSTEIDMPFDALNDKGESFRASRDHGLSEGWLLRPEDHVIWVDVEGPETKRGTTYCNKGEIEAIGKILESINKAPKFESFQKQWSKDEDKEIGVITFYGAQLKELRSFTGDSKMCTDGRKRRYYRDIPVRIDTVDRFQGMERNILIVSTVRSDKQVIEDVSQHKVSHEKNNTTLGFATDPKRINVAFSRARRLLIVVGNKKHFSKHPLYSNVIKTIEVRGQVIPARNL